MSNQNTGGRQFRVQGGSASDVAISSGAGQLGFFQKGVKYVFPSGKKTIEGRFLPARDNSLSVNDTAWPISVIPYRDMHSGHLDKDTQTPAFTSWYVNVLGYRFFGRSSESFLSPLTLKGLGMGASPIDTADPVVDCYTYVKKLIGDRPDLEYLIEKPKSKKENQIIPWPRTSSLFNMLVKDEKAQYEVAVVSTALAALEDLKMKLMWPTPAGTAPADADFPQYLFGDITSPEKGAYVRTAQVPVGTITTNGFVLSNQQFTLTGYKILPLSSVPGGEKDILEARYDLLSSDVLKVLTYQQLVDFLVQDGAIPHFIIEAACSNMANVPAAAKQNTVVSSPAPLQNHSTPVASAPAVSVPSDSGDKFWIVGSQGKVELVDSNTLREIVGTGGMTVQVMAENQVGGWKDSSEFGFKLPEPEPPVVPQPPAAPQPPAPSSVPQPPAPPVAPVVPQAPEIPAAPEPVKEEKKYWIVGIGGAVSLELESEVRAHVDLGGDPMIMPEDKSGGWKPASQLGFTPPAPTAPQPPAPPEPPAAPAPPEPPAAPQPPAPPAPPQAPVVPDVPQPPSATQVPQAPAAPQPPAAPKAVEPGAATQPSGADVTESSLLTPQEQARLKELREASKKTPSITTDQIKEMVALIKKAQGN